LKPIEVCWTDSGSDGDILEKDVGEKVNSSRPAVGEDVGEDDGEDDGKDVSSYPCGVGDKVYTSCVPDGEGVLEKIGMDLSVNVSSEGLGVGSVVSSQGMSVEVGTGV